MSNSNSRTSFKSLIQRKTSSTIAPASQQQQAVAIIPYEQQELQAFANVIKMMEDIIAITPPTKVLYLAIDGVAGMCKQSQQRKRRYKGAKERAATSSLSSSAPFDTCHISAGTPFMSRLCEYIHNWILSYKQTHPIIQVIYSDMYVEGEGEHKLIRYLDGACKANTTYCIYSPDADLIMLCMCLSQGRGYISRENIYDDVKGKWILVDCTRLKNLVSDSIRWVSQSPAFQYNPHRAVRDYVLFLMLIGNDFLPSLYCLEIGNDGIDILQRSYISAASECGYLVNEVNNINKATFVKLFEYLASNESIMILKKYHKGARFPDNLLNGCIEHVKVKKESTGPDGQPIESFIYQQHLNFNALRTQYYTNKFKGMDWGSQSDSDEVKIHKFQANVSSICKEYIRGLNFVEMYYTMGIPSFEWCYPEHYAPMMIDLYHYSKSCDQKQWDAMQTFNYKPPLTLNQSLLGVIPPSSSKVLPASVQSILEKNANHHLFSEQFEVDLEGKQQDYEGICLLPNVSYTTLKRMCKDTSMSQEPTIY